MQFCLNGDDDDASATSGCERSGHKETDTREELHIDIKKESCAAVPHIVAGWPGAVENCNLDTELSLWCAAHQR